MVPTGRSTRLTSLLLLWASLALASCTGDTTIARGVGFYTLTPEVIEMQPTAVGTTSFRTVFIDNNSTASVTINSIQLLDNATNYFRIVGDPTGQLERGGSVEVNVEFVPASAGLHTATLAITSDAGGGESEDSVRQFVVRGQAADAEIHVYPASVDFGIVPDGDTVSRTLTIVSNALVPLEVSLLEMTGDPEFSVVLPASITQLPALIQPNDSLAVQVEFGSAGLPASGTVRIHSTDPADPQFPVNLQANQCADSEGSSFDGDGDGYSVCGGDCDDAVAAIRPGAVEALDAVDNDCDGIIDEGTLSYDDDGDGLSELDGDCNDDDDQSYPGAPEVVDGRDNDCDGDVDDGTADLDDDGDGFAEVGGDCDDDNDAVHPAAGETLDGIDNDCDGLVDEGTTAFDDDADTITEDAGDCNDADPNVLPGAPELANGVDDDCDGTIDEGTANFDDDRGRIHRGRRRLRRPERVHQPGRHRDRRKRHRRRLRRRRTVSLRRPRGRAASSQGSKTCRSKRSCPRCVASGPWIGPRCAGSARRPSRSRSPPVTR